MNPLSYELKDKVAVVRMDDGKANALSFAMIEALGNALDRARDEAKALVIFGRPGRFSAGFDLKVMLNSPRDAERMLRAGSELFLRILEHIQPVVMGVTGHALAAGLLLAACGDVRIGARGDFKLGLNEVSIGMAVPIFAQELARMRLDPRRLDAATLLATIYDPEGARDVGWLDLVSAPESLEAEVLAEATRLTASSGPHFVLTKHTLRREAIAYVRRTVDENLGALAAVAAVPKD